MDENQSQIKIRQVGCPSRLLKFQSLKLAIHEFESVIDQTFTVYKIEESCVFELILIYK